MGAGGNGSKLVVGMKNMDGALRALGHPGIHLALADGDLVSDSNLVRQSFYPSDVGLPKATVLINRINLSCGLAWEALPRHVTADDIARCGSDLLVSCVDSRKARADVQEGLERNRRVLYHMDLGNTRDSGQVTLGQPLGYYNRRKRDRLRTAFELFPELTDTTLPEDDTPSCSTMEALEKQDLFVNDLLVTVALALLWRLFRYGEITHHGAFVSAATGSVRPLPIDPALWRRLKRQGERTGTKAAPWAQAVLE
ncbi:MAG: PRTRC system ThiF family protein [Deinococcota bacterium]|nr:PRTRC system ThiF family protein [Deinococcota bacterium]